MALVRTIARPLISAVFVAGGLSQLRQPGAQAKRVQPVTDLVSRSVPRAPQETETLVRINGATQFVIGLLFALGRLPRLSALVLAASLVPTTAGAHRFWEDNDPAERFDQQFHFFKNAGLFGGLLFAAVARRGRRRSGRRARTQRRHRSQ